MQNFYFFVFYITLVLHDDNFWDEICLMKFFRIRNLMQFIF